MSWKIIPVMSEPKAEIMWSGLYGKTKLEINGHEVEKDSEIAINIMENPMIKVTLVSTNVGQSGLVWLAIMAEVEFYGSKKVSYVPLFIKQAPIDTGDILVGIIEEPFTEIVRYIVSATMKMKITGFRILLLTGVNDITSIIRAPRYYVRIIGRKGIYPLYNYTSLVSFISNVFETGKGKLVDINSIEPLDIPELKIKIPMSDAGFNYIELSRYVVKPVELIRNIQWDLLIDASTDRG